MTTTLRKPITRRELEALVDRDIPEGSLGMIRLLISPRVLLELCGYIEQDGTRVEVLELYGDPGAAEIRFFRRDI